MMKLMIGYDGSAGSDAALDGLRHAGLPPDTQALIVSVADVMMAPENWNPEVFEPAINSPRVTSRLLLAQKQSERTLLQIKALATRATERLRSYFPSWDVKAEVISGQPSLELISKAEEWKPDLVVVGSHGHSAAGRLINGSVTKKIVTDSNHSVRVTRGVVSKDEDDRIRILIGVDGSTEAEQAVRAVGRRVWPSGTQVQIVAVDNGTSPARVARLLPTVTAMINSHNAESAHGALRMVEWAENELSMIGLDVSTVIEKGDPRRVLIQQAQKWNADSIFVGGRRFTGAIERFRLGSVATALVTKAPCSVEVIR
ncbi:MAG TPA: universal stress protein [Pyrinomonadaceae bacterium]|jgi:nucleotide-binding universal stress UspA family protein